MLPGPPHGGSPLPRPPCTSLKVHSVLDSAQPGPWPPENTDSGMSMGDWGVMAARFRGRDPGFTQGFPCPPGAGAGGRAVRWGISQLLH